MKYNIEEENAFSNLVFKLQLSPCTNLSYFIPGNLPVHGSSVSFDWSPTNIIYQVKDGLSFAKTLGNRHDHRRNGYIACYKEGKYIYLYGDGWEQDLINAGKEGRVRKGEL